MTTTSGTEAVAVLEGVYAAEVHYLAAGGPGVATFESLAQLFAADVVLHQAESLPHGGIWRGPEHHGEQHAVQEQRW
ncbi:hypothetical protein ACWDZ4_08075 [Streptomyces sp. NPDC003016]